MWFVYLFLTCNLIYIWFMPKNLTRQEIYVSWGITAAIAINTDLTLGAIIDLYDFGKNGVQFYDLIVDAIFPPSLGVIFLNFLPKERRRAIRYILIWTAVSVGIEWLTVFAGFEKLKGWSPWYSSVVYLLVFIFLRWHLYFIRRKTI